MSKINVTKLLSSEISYKDAIEIITNNLDAQKYLNKKKFKKSATMQISSNSERNMEHALKFIDHSKTTRSTIKLISIKI